MKLLREYPEKVLLGKDLQGSNIYLLKPRWECDWYWSFGHLHVGDMFIHLNYLGNSVLLDGIKVYFSELVISDKELWIFCELVESIKTLKSTAQLFTLGGANICSVNPCRDLLLNKHLADEINSTLIPNLIDEVYKVLKK